MAEAEPTMASESRLRFVSIYPVILGTYGDGGNLTVLATRARARGYDVEAIELEPGEPVPAGGDLYLLGGGEDDAQVAAARTLRADGGLARAVGGGAVVFGVCAGYQLLGAVFPGSDGAPEAGLDLLDVTTDRLPARAVGELLATPCAEGLLEPLTGYENHAGATRLGRDARPLARVEAGVGNGSGVPASEGAIQGRLLGTYLHGPGLARNPELADLLVSWVVGSSLEPWPQPDIDALRAERLGAVGSAAKQRTKMVGSRRRRLA
jgi:lipid II isoglutaminyl synthase (glutamine-hydrolysing)